MCAFSLHQFAPSKSNLSNVQELVIVTRRDKTGRVHSQPWASLSCVTSKDRLPRQNKSVTRPCRSMEPSCDPNCTSAPKFFKLQTLHYHYRLCIADRCWQMLTGKPHGRISFAFELAAKASQPTQPPTYCQEGRETHWHQFAHPAIGAIVDPSGIPAEHCWHSGMYCQAEGGLHPHQ